MNLEEYEKSGRSRYKMLAKLVASLLERDITKQSEYRLQQIQHRAKTLESLRRRLNDIEQLDTDEIESHRKDLAGCRIIFYTNNDVNRFVNSGLLGKLFDIDWERSKFHHPGPGQHSEKRLFQSHNYVLKLKPDRTALPEYCEFEGLYCEVQVQTILNHAWAEMAHDTIYKRPDLHGFGARHLKLIQSTLEDAMREHLLPAGYLFQRIATDVDRLAEGKMLFDKGVLDAALTAGNNNDRYEALVRLKENVLPYYDDLPGILPEIRDKLKRTWLAADATETVPHETPFGDYPGWDPHLVTAQIAEIFEQYRYIHPDENYALIRDLYVSTSDPKSRERLLRLAKSLAQPTMQVWERYGPLIQTQLAKSLSDETDIALIAPLATTIAREILCSEISGATWSSSAVTLSRSAITYSPDLEAARRSVVDVFSRYAHNVIKDDDALQSVLTTLFDSGRWLQHGAIPPKIVIMIFEELAHAVECITPTAPQASLNSRQNIESILFQRWRLNRLLPKSLASESEVVEAHQRLIEAIKALRDVLNADQEFTIFKTIVGYKSIFPHQWVEENDDFTHNEEVRILRQDELADTITSENWPVWKTRLATAARVKSNELATFPPYVRFLSSIATRKPRLSFELLADRSILPDWTISPIASALIHGELREEVEGLLAQWVDGGNFLSEIATVATASDDTLSTLVSKVTSRVVSEADEKACTILILQAIRRFAESPQLWRDDIFFSCLDVLNRASNHDWIGRSWNDSGNHSLFANLTADQSHTVLEAMVNLRHVDYTAENILNSIALTSHQMVLDFLGRRIEIGRQKTSSEFDSVPFSLQCLHKALQPHPRDILESIRRWIEPNDYAATLDATRFLSKVYPELQEPLPSTLRGLVRTATAEDLAFLGSVLRGFNGRQEVFPICRYILASDKADNVAEDYVSSVLLETGVMSGQFGPAETYQEKVELLKPWLDDKNDRVAKFAARFIQELESMVASEYRRAKEEIAMQKLQYGEAIHPHAGNGRNDDT